MEIINASIDETIVSKDGNHIATVKVVFTAKQANEMLEKSSDIQKVKEKAVKETIAMFVKRYT